MLKKTEKPKTRCGYVAIIGRPNAGKSTLLNQLLDFKLSIVTAKPQTTRQRILGIMNEDNVQIIFLDTPGLIKPKYALQTAMMKIADQAIQTSDILLVMIDVTSEEDSDFVLELFQNALKNLDLPKILLLNKVDLVPKEQLLPLIHRFHAVGVFKEIIPISALNNDGVDIVKKNLIDLLPFGERFYPEDTLTEQPEKFFVSEIIREKIFLYYGKEVPYSTDVIIEEFKERNDSKDFIRATIIVERQSQKVILIGKNGEAIKRVGEESRKDIERFLDRKVFLELWVKVKEDWRKNNTVLKNLGYL
ncbi:GTPase Era [bacterium]|nr:MAG: GTPase Era [bacterium]